MENTISDISYTLTSIQSSEYYVTVAAYSDIPPAPPGRGFPNTFRQGRLTYLGGSRFIGPLTRCLHVHHRRAPPAYFFVDSMILSICDGY